MPSPNGADALAFSAKIKELEAARNDLAAKLSRPAGQPLLHPSLANKVYRERWNASQRRSKSHGMAAKSSNSSAV
jgi:hypothetical protein